MKRQNPTPVVMLTVNNFGECDKWYNLKDDIQFDVVCIWTHRGMIESMYDFFNRVVEAKHQVDVILPKPAIKYTVRSVSDLTGLCALMEMLYA